jgi:REP element-mobilizing transposase RayT
LRLLSNDVGDNLACMAHPPRIPVWLPQEREVVYFVTLCVMDRRPVLGNAAAFYALEIAVSKLTHWHVYAAVLMPDHLHLLAAPSERDERIGNFSGAIKKWMRRELAGEAPCSPDWQWQPGCFDRLLRTNESAQAKWEYMRENPVRAGLVERWEDWPYSIGFRFQKL